MKRKARSKTARRGGDPIQANILGAVALAIGAGGIILPLPLGLAGMLVGAWGVWRHGRTALALAGLAGATLLTVLGIALGLSL
ncbi:MAG: hypothetical protein KIT16_12555 [Rhodospirillaceae bacterium]|nr:hypothetical protein [Rhodospirillaceae bacterium]